MKAGLIGIAIFSFAGVAQAALTDAQIVKIVKTADEVEVDAAKTAKSKASDERVKDFAKQMIEEHKANEKDAKKTAKANNLKPEKSDISKNMEETTKAKVKELKEYKGAAFDKAYMDLQVSMHQQLLNDLDQNYIPNAQNSELKSFLQDTRGHVEAHLNKAKEIQSTLK
jgi:putative membrane protein